MLRSRRGHSRKAHLPRPHGVKSQAPGTRAFWSIVNARRVIGYAPEDDAEIKFADEIRQYLIEPARGVQVPAT